MILEKYSSKSLSTLPKRLFEKILLSIFSKFDDNEWGIDIKPHQPKHKIVTRKIDRKKEMFFQTICEHNKNTLISLINEDITLLSKLNSHNLTPLMSAVASKNYFAIELFLKYGANPNYTDEDGWSALTYAIFINDIKSMSLLKSSKILIDSPDNSGVMFYLGIQK